MTRPIPRLGPQDMCLRLAEMVAVDPSDSQTKVEFVHVVDEKDLFKTLPYVTENVTPLMVRDRVHFRTWMDNRHILLRRCRHVVQQHFH